MLVSPSHKDDNRRPEGPGAYHSGVIRIQKPEPIQRMLLCISPLPTRSTTAPKAGPEVAVTVGVFTHCSKQAGWGQMLESTCLAYVASKTGSLIYFTLGVFDDCQLLVCAIV